ncbi:MAG: N-alpha-acetyltransferase 10/11, partial [Actinomycetota bacterium]
LISAAGSDRVVPLAADYSTRLCGRGDTEALGALYFDAYDPGSAATTLQDAVEDIEASFGGAYGQMWDEATRVVTREGQIVAGVLTVVRAPWDDVPECPFVIELFTARAHRRRGLSSHLVAETLAAAARANEPAIALRVDAQNGAAMRLYESLGFIPWVPSTGGADPA